MAETMHLAAQFAERHPEEAAAVLELLAADDVHQLLQRLPERTVAAICQTMLPTAAAEQLTRLSPERMGRVAPLLAIDVVASIIRPSREDFQQRMLATLSSRQREAVEKVLRYPVSSAGALMDPAIGGWRDTLTVAEAQKQLQSVAHHAHAYLYVVDAHNRLVGVIGSRELVEAAETATLGEVMHPGVQAIEAYASQEAIRLHPAWDDFHALPVVDEDKRLLGIIRYKTLRRLSLLEAPATRNPMQTAFVFGELCWNGMLAVWEAMSAVTRPTARR